MRSCTRGSFYCLVVLLLAVATSMQAEPPANKPLDLPAGTSTRDALVGKEEQLATMIAFGQSYTAHTFVFCIEQSTTLNCWRIPIIIELEAALAQLPPEVEFSVVMYQTGAQNFSTAPVKATPENQAAAVSWVSSSAWWIGTCCMMEGVLSAVEVANQSDAHEQAMILITSGDTGGATTQLTCEAISSANFQRDTIHVATPQLVGPTDWLAPVAYNTPGGTLAQLPPPMPGD